MQYKMKQYYAIHATFKFPAQSRSGIFSTPPLGMGGMSYLAQLSFLSSSQQYQHTEGRHVNEETGHRSKQIARGVQNSV